jgi:hypothetical protein
MHGMRRHEGKAGGEGGARREWRGAVMHGMRRHEGKPGGEGRARHNSIVRVAPALVPNVVQAWASVSTLVFHLSTWPLQSDLHLHLPR